MCGEQRRKRSTSDVAEVQIHTDLVWILKPRGRRRRGGARGEDANGETHREKRLGEEREKTHTVAPKKERNGERPTKKTIAAKAYLDEGDGAKSVWMVFSHWEMLTAARRNVAGDVFMD